MFYFFVISTIRPGDIPTVDNLKEYLHKNGSPLNETWTSLKKIPASAVLSQDSSNRTGELSPAIDDLESESTSALSNTPQKRKQEKSVFLSRNSNIVKGGTDVVLNGLAAYLRYLEGTARDDWQEYVKFTVFAFCCQPSNRFSFPAWGIDFLFFDKFKVFISENKLKDLRGDAQFAIFYTGI